MDAGSARLEIAPNIGQNSIPSTADPIGVDALMDDVGIKVAGNRLEVAAAHRVNVIEDPLHRV
jgi:hypothetical protein